MLEAGFIFWGLFLVFGLIVAGYLVWMYSAERGEADRDPQSEPVSKPGPEIQSDSGIPFKRESP